MTDRCRANGCAEPLTNGSPYCCSKCQRRGELEAAYWSMRLDSLRRQTQVRQGSRSVLHRELRKRNVPLFQAEPGEFGFAVDTEILTEE